MKKTFFLIGPPNSGKTAIFNSLTGMHFKSTNYPGATVERRVGLVKNLPEFELIDLPGLYSLSGQALDEKITRDHLLNVIGPYRSANENGSYHGVILVLDSTRLSKSLYLAMELKSLEIPVLLCLNMNDLAEQRGQKLDLQRVSEFFPAGFWQGSAFSDSDIKELEKRIQSFSLESLGPQKFATPIESSEVNTLLHSLKDPSQISYLFKEVDELIGRIVIKPIRPDSLTGKLDRFFTHVFWGPLFLLILLLFIFETLFTFAAPLQDGLTWIFDWAIHMIRSQWGVTEFTDFLTDGIIAGVGGVLVFLPQILLLFAMIILLEDSGHLSRMAYLCDSLFKRFGLPGNAVIPLLSGHACAIPAMMSARALPHHEDRLTTILITPLTACSARIPVYSLLIASLVPREDFLGPVSYQGLTMLFLYLLGIASSLITALLLKKYRYQSSARSLLMELPSYRMPRLKNLWVGLKMRSASFLKQAGTIIFVLSILLWVISYYPKNESNTDSHDSYAAMMGKTIAPIFAPLGFDWKLTAALIPSFAAREVMVTALATTYAVEDVESEEGLKGLQERIRESYPVSTIWALLLWFVFAPQCISTFAVMKRETGTWKWPLVMMSYTLALAYVSGLIVKLF
jgi:ferrous iron transport protein B